MLRDCYNSGGPLLRAAGRNQRKFRRHIRMLRSIVQSSWRVVAYIEEPWFNARVVLTTSSLEQAQRHLRQSAGVANCARFIPVKNIGTDDDESVRVFHRS